MGLLDTAQQLINGSVYDFSSIKLVAGPRAFTRISAINYEHGVEQGLLRGTSTQILGTTNGQYDASGSLTIYKEDFEELIAFVMSIPKLPGLNVKAGWMQKRFPIVVNYSSPSTGKILTDVLEGVRITRHSNNHSVGSDPLQNELTLHIMKVIPNGMPPVL